MAPELAKVGQHSFAPPATLEDERSVDLATIFLYLGFKLFLTCIRVKMFARMVGADCFDAGSMAISMH